VTDFLRVDKRFFGLTGSQWTGLTVATICIVTLIVWAIQARRRAGPGDLDLDGERVRPVTESE
jgi:hypothetical protein